MKKEITAAVAAGAIVFGAGCTSAETEGSISGIERLEALVGNSEHWLGPVAVDIECPPGDIKLPKNTVVNAVDVEHSNNYANGYGEEGQNIFIEIEDVWLYESEVGEVACGEAVEHFPDIDTAGEGVTYIIPDPNSCILTDIEAGPAPRQISPDCEGEPLTYRYYEDEVSTPPTEENSTEAPSSKIQPAPSPETSPDNPNVPLPSPVEPEPSNQQPILVQKANPAERVL